MSILQLPADVIGNILDVYAMNVEDLVVYVQSLEMSSFCVSLPTHCVFF